MKQEDIDKYIKQIHFKCIPSNPERVYSKVYNKIQKENGEFKYKRSLSLWKYSTVVASVAILILLYIVVIQKQDTINSKDSYQSVFREISGLSGSKTKLYLPDSTEVWLGGNSSIKFPIQFAEKNRTIELSGRGFFKVKKNKKKPFFVKMENISIEVLGTTFNIEMDRQNKTIETTLLEGAISFKNSHYKKERRMEPNQQIIYYKDADKAIMKTVDASLYSSWVTNKFLFNKLTLSDIVIYLERAFDTKIYIKDDCLKKMQITAQFTNDESLDKILSILQVTAHYKYKKIKGEYFITK